MKPLVSCIMATMAGRKPFLDQALKYFLRQTHPEKELIVVDDDVSGPPPKECPGVRYVRLDRPARAPKKLNVAARIARGRILCKIDDDDWYAPTLLERALAQYLAHEQENPIVHFKGFVLLFLQEWLTRSDPEWRAGNLMMFPRLLWEKAPFREVSEDNDDVDFYHDHPHHSVTLPGPELSVVIRHGLGHMWRDVLGEDVEDFFRRLKPVGQPPEQLLPEEDLRFYRQLHLALNNSAQAAQVTDSLVSAPSPAHPQSEAAQTQPG